MGTSADGHVTCDVGNRTVGEEAVEWLCQHGGLSRDEALTAGQELLKTGVFKCTSREQKFEANAKTLYQFQGSYADLRKQVRLGRCSSRAPVGLVGWVW